MMQNQNPSRARKPHPQWAFQTESGWQTTGKAKVWDDKDVYRKLPRNPQPAWAPNPPGRSRRAGGGGHHPLNGGGFMPQQNGQFSPGRSQPPPAKHRNVNKHGAVSHGNSPNFRQSYNNDPFYQPPPKIPQMDHGRLVTFYKNGDAIFRGVPVSINRSFANLGAVLHYLTREFGFNCQRIFHWPHGYEIAQINEFEHQSSYVVSDLHHLDRSINYGGIMDPVPGNLKVNTSRVGDEEFYKGDYDDDAASSSYTPQHTPYTPYTPYTSQSNHPAPPYANHVGSKRAEDIPLYRDYDPSDTLENYPVATIRLVNNFNRTAHVEVSLSGTRKNFKVLLHEFGQFFGLRDCSIWTSRLPCKKVEGLAQLYAELEKNPQFLVCGSEEMPTEAAGLQHSPDQAMHSPGRSHSNGHQSRKSKSEKPLAGIRAYSPYDEDRLVRKQLSGRDSSPSIIFSPQQAPSRSDVGPTKANYVGRKTRKMNNNNNKIDNSDIDDLPSGRFSGTGMAMMNEQPMSPVKASRSFETLTRRNKQAAVAMPKRAMTKGQLISEGKIKRRVGLQLEWVYGYRGKDARENMFFLPSGELLYYVGVVAVVYDPINEVQRHYKAHTEDINCIAVHPTDPLVATGQIAPVHSDQQPHVRIWNYESLNTVATIGLGVFQASICCVSFSSDGSKLMVLDEGDRHSLSVWKWSEDKQIAQTPENVDEDGAFTRPTASDTIVWGKFCPNDAALLITFGKEHLYFWKLTNNSKLIRDRSSGIFTDQFPQPKFITAATFLPNGDLITGDSNGSLLVWTRNVEQTYIINTSYSQALSQAHKKSVFAVVVTGPNHILSGGGVEVKSWELKDNTVITTGAQSILESSGLIRSLVVGKSNAIYAGTTKNCILEGALQGKFRYIIQGHSDEVWALACHSKDSTFVTGGYDCQLIKWFAPIHRSVWRTPLEKQCLSVAFHPHEDVVAIGTSVGRLVVLNSYNGMHVCSVQMAGATDLLTCLSFAPEGDMIVCGSQDGPIYVSFVEDGARTYRRHKAGIIENTMGAVQNMDWHEEVAELIQFSTRSGNHCFATIEDMKVTRVEASTISDEWSTYTCPSGKLVKNVVNKLKAGEALTACDMVGRNSPIAGLLASSTTYGRILLTALRPDVEIEAKLQESRMCSQNITALRFTSDGRYLIAVAGKDGSIYQYATNITELWGTNVAPPHTH